MADKDRRLALAVEAAREAGQITLRYFRRDDLQVDLKADDSPVTIADREAEQHLRKRILETFPEDAILGEEFPDHPGTSGFRWILDPIDGTKSFIHGVPLYSTLVAVERESRSLLGVIRIPALAECVYAAVGCGAWHTLGNGLPRRAKVSSRRTLSEGLFVTSEVANFSKAGCHQAYENLEAAARLSRSWGDGYGYLLVATGRAEVMVDPIMAPWDAAPLLPILEGAGGTFTDWQGRPTTHSDHGVATNGLVLNEVMNLLESNM